MVKFFDRKAEELLVSAKAKKRSLLADKITGDNIYKALIFFDKLPIIEKEFTLSLDNDAQNETVYLLSFSIEKCSTHQKRFQLRTELKPF